MPEIAAVVTRTVTVTMKPFRAYLYFDEDGKRRCAVQYAEYHDEVFARELALQDAPPDKGDPVLDAVYGAMMAAAAAALQSAMQKPAGERDANETYLAALMEAANG